MDGQFASKACVSVVVVKQENLQLKAHLVRRGLINNSSAAQWDHKSANGTPKDDRGTAGASAVGRRRQASSKYCTQAEARMPHPLYSQLTLAFQRAPELFEWQENSE